MDRIRVKIRVEDGIAAKDEAVKTHLVDGEVSDLSITQHVLALLC